MVRNYEIKRRYAKKATVGMTDEEGVDRGWIFMDNVSEGSVEIMCTGGKPGGQSVVRYRFQPVDGKWTPVAVSFKLSRPFGPIDWDNCPFLLISEEGIEMAQAAIAVALAAPVQED